MFSIWHETEQASWVTSRESFIYLSKLALAIFPLCRVLDDWFSSEKIHKLFKIIFSWSRSWLDLQLQMFLTLHHLNDPWGTHCLYSLLGTHSQQLVHLHVLQDLHSHLNISILSSWFVLTNLLFVSGVSVLVNGVNVHPIPKLKYPFPFAQPCLPVPHAAHPFLQMFPNSDSTGYWNCHAHLSTPSLLC